ncbi:MAG: phage terminase large subunit, partial [bacterium]
MSEKSYKSKKANMLPEIFMANYHQKPVDVKGRLYKSFKTYSELPMHPFEKIISYTDTADTGEDYLCSIVAGIYMGEAYVLDVYYTKEGMEITEPRTAALFVSNEVNDPLVESNNGGRGFARNVERLIWENHGKRITVRWFHQSKNKRARIISGSTFVMNHIYFPWNWKDRWPDYYDAMTSYQKEGKNAHDDAADCTTGIGEMINGKKEAGAW